jgi:hypothetical protein
MQLSQALGRGSSQVREYFMDIYFARQVGLGVTRSISGVDEHDGLTLDQFVQFGGRNENSLVHEESPIAESDDPSLE